MSRNSALSLASKQGGKEKIGKDVKPKGSGVKSQNAEYKTYKDSTVKSNGSMKIVSSGAQGIPVEAPDLCPEVNLAEKRLGENKGMGARSKWKGDKGNEGMGMGPKEKGVDKKKEIFFYKDDFDLKDGALLNKSHRGLSKNVVGNPVEAPNQIQVQGPTDEKKDKNRYSTECVSIECTGEANQEFKEKQIRFQEIHGIQVLDNLDEKRDNPDCLATEIEKQQKNEHAKTERQEVEEITSPREKNESDDEVTDIELGTEVPLEEQEELEAVKSGAQRNTSNNVSDQEPDQVSLRPAYQQKQETIKNSPKHGEVFQSNANDEQNVGYRHKDNKHYNYQLNVHERHQDKVRYKYPAASYYQSEVSQYRRKSARTKMGLQFWNNFMDPRTLSLWDRFYHDFYAYIAFDADNIHETISQILQGMDLAQTNKATAVIFTQNFATNWKPEQRICDYLNEHHPMVYYMQAEDKPQAADNEIACLLRKVDEHASRDAFIYIVSEDTGYQSLADELTRCCFLDVKYLHVREVLGLIKPKVYGDDDCRRRPPSDWDERKVDTNWREKSGRDEPLDWPRGRDDCGTSPRDGGGDVNSWRRNADGRIQSTRDHLVGGPKDDGHTNWRDKGDKNETRNWCRGGDNYGPSPRDGGGNGWRRDNVNRQQLPTDRTKGSTMDDGKAMMPMNKDYASRTAKGGKDEPTDWRRGGDNCRSSPRIGRGGVDVWTRGGNDGSQQPKACVDDGGDFWTRGGNDRRPPRGRIDRGPRNDGKDWKEGRNLNIG